MINIKKLVNLRELHNWTQKEVAKKLGIASPTYSSYEIGHRQPDSDMLQKISNLYNVSVDYLLDNDSTSKLVQANDLLDEVMAERIKQLTQNDMEREIFEKTGQLSDEQKRVILGAMREMTIKSIKVDDETTQ